MSRVRSGSTSLLLLIALALITSACGGGTTAAPTTSGAPGPLVTSPPASSGGGGSVGGDACKLLTNDDIHAATGMTPSGSSHGASGSVNVCHWALDTGQELLVAVYAGGGAGPASYDAAPGASVSGVGDKAKWAADAHLLTVLKGNTAFSVGVIIVLNVTADQNLDSAKQLGQIIAGEL